MALKTRSLLIEFLTSSASGEGSAPANDLQWPTIQISPSSGATISTVNVYIKAGAGAGWVLAETYTALAEAVVWVSPAAALYAAKVAWSGLAGGTVALHLSGTEVL